MEVYKAAVRMAGGGVDDGTYLVGIDLGSQVLYKWIKNCNNHEEAAARGLWALAAKDRLPYGVAGPCRTDCACWDDTLQNVCVS